ncbi:unnamed protein product, partial [Meganyctiphanes norvegica]
MKDNIYLQKELCELKYKFSIALKERNSLLKFKKSNIKANTLKHKILELKSRIRSKVSHTKKLALNLHASKTKQKGLIEKNKSLQRLNRILKYQKNQLNKSKKSVMEQNYMHVLDSKKLQSDLQKAKKLYSGKLLEFKSLTQKYNSSVENNTELEYKLKKSNELQTQLRSEWKQLNLKKKKIQQNIEVLKNKQLRIDHNNTSPIFCKKTNTNIFNQFSDFYSSLP